MIDNNIEQYLNKLSYTVSEGRNAKFSLPYGHRYVIEICYKKATNYIMHSLGTYITLQYNNVKFPIGSRCMYDTFEDAYNVACFWRALMNRSKGWGCNKWTDAHMYIIDTCKTPSIQNNYGDKLYVFDNNVVEV